MNQICVIGVDLSQEDRKVLKALSKKPPKILKGFPTDREFIRHARLADCILVARGVSVSASVLQQCPHLKCIGVVGTGIENVDLAAAQTAGIKVAGIEDYCNVETAEFVVATVLNTIRGLGSKSWNLGKSGPKSLSELKFGVVGFGRVGKEVARSVNALGGDVYYFSKSGPNAEGAPYKYLSLNELLQTCDVIDLHTPADLIVLDASHFKILGSKPRLLVNTCKGQIWDTKAYERWIRSPSNFLIADSVAARTAKIKKRQNVWITDVSAYSTPTVMRRRNAYLLELVRGFESSLKVTRGD